jgi:hypothetical protein
MEITLDKRKTIGLLLISTASILIMGSYIHALNTFNPLVHVKASDYAPPTPEGGFGDTITYGFIIIGVAILAAIIFYSKDRILDLIT